MSFGTGSTPKTAASGFTLPSQPATTAPTPGFQFNTGSGDNKLQNKPATGLFASSSVTGLSLGSTAPKTVSSALSFGAPAVSTSAPSLGAAATSTALSSAPQLSFGASTTTSTSFTPILGSTAASSSTGITLGTSTASSTAPAKLSFEPKTTVTAPSTLTSTALPTLAPTNVTSTTSSIPATGSLTFAQLEDSINKWTIDLEEQGKFFINQAKQLNAWDTLLISNGEKILNLNSSIERVKQQQQQLDQELDFVLAQQKELEELIVPLEKELVEIPVTDIDRNQMYQFSEIIDSQLKQMSDDLKEIIEHINESNKDEEVSNPITQISRILNAHMNSLQWIDRNTAQISAQLEQISKMQDQNRRNFSLNQSLNHSMNM
ncbi:nuclear pore glycoprotein p62 [Anoplophora glabripennis]|uniref:nuclear pore glycoprotein p62 n=1 Tax=Anoplophora glabripennis TaxID=217634 RepID=UPI000874902D|nr:nuclear pore glycoprotein p62 [Anoplophora glabripennis]